MAKEASVRPKRYPVRMSEETKRRLGVLAADADQRVEDFAGNALAGTIDRLYDEYRRRIAKEGSK